MIYLHKIKPCILQTIIKIYILQTAIYYNIKTYIQTTYKNLYITNSYILQYKNLYTNNYITNNYIQKSFKKSQHPVPQAQSRKAL